jgi:ParB family transcriptional regulator, chromosome partitioning protein
MTTTTPTIITIPLNKLVPSAANARRTGQKMGVAALAASISAHGLQQNLNVRLAPSGRYEVVAGNRRLAALKQLAKAKALAKDAPIPCRVLAEGDDPTEISLAENTMREPMHPDDECRAFLALAEGKGMAIDDIAARFGTSPAIVRQRLKLARVSPSLRARFREGELTMAHMMALAISDDHAAQEQAWENLPDWNREPYLLKQALTHEAVPLTDKLAVLVGVAAYEAAGGSILRDLFDAEDEGYMADRALVQRLAAAIMADAVAAVQAEGWQWVIPEATRDYSTRYSRIYPQPEGGTLRYAPEDMARAGARVLLEHDGTLRVERGLVHPDAVKAEAKAATAEQAGQARAALPASMVAELTAHRTAALRLELSRNPAVALAATVQALAVALFYPGSHSCLAIRADSEPLARHAVALDDCPAHAAMATEARLWGEQLPDDPATLFAWCLAQPQELLLDLLAFLAASSINAVQMKGDSPVARIYRRSWSLRLFDERRGFNFLSCELARQEMH